MTHSQGGRVGWQTDADDIAAIVAIEPGYAPKIGSPEYEKFLAAKIPMVFRGDDGDPSCKSFGNPKGKPVGILPCKAVSVKPEALRKKIQYPPPPQILLPVQSTGRIFFPPQGCEGLIPKGQGRNVIWYFIAVLYIFGSGLASRLPAFQNVHAPPSAENSPAVLFPVLEA